jgi:putative protein kinase ArgK-like GTPase of G3E family
VCQKRGLNDASTTPQPDTAPGVGHAIILITGIRAAGKSTIAQALAERLPRSVLKGHCGVRLKHRVQWLVYGRSARSRGT